MSCRLTRLGYGLVNALIKCQISYDTNNVPLNLQGVSAKLINPLEELQAPIGNYVVTVALDLQTVSVSPEHLFTLHRNQNNQPQSLQELIQVTEIVWTQLTEEIMG